MRRKLGVASTLAAFVALSFTIGVASAVAQAPVSFSEPVSFTVGTFPSSVAVGDFNADSDPDLAVANQFSSDVSVLLGGAAGSFSGPTSFPTGSFSSSVAVGDFNADHDPDLAVANALDGTVSILLGSSGGGFTGPTNFPVGTFPSTVAVGDLNGDQDPDLVVADHRTGDLSVLTGGPGGSFSGPTIVATDTGTAAVAVGEFNQDGDPDLAVGDYDTGRVLVLLGGSGVTFGGPTTVATGVDPISVAVGEFNQDGDPDLAVAEESGRVLVLLGGPGGGFTGSTAVVSGSQALAGLSSMAVGDFNRDGDPDLVVAHRSENQVRVLLGGPGGSFGSPIDSPTGTLPASVAVADFNADGKPDLATTHPTTNTVAVLLNTTVTNRAPAVTDDAYTTAEDTTLTVAPPGVLGNDSDPDGDALTAVLVSGPAHGTLTLNADGSFNYTPAADYNGPDSFIYKATDGSLESTTATVKLTVTAFEAVELTTRTQAMDGDLKVPPGSDMRVGYSFTIPGDHPTATIGLVAAKVTFNVTCTIGTPSRSTFAVAITDQSYVDPQNSSAWYPSGDQTYASTYQGSAPVPTCSDPRGLVRLQQGGTFSASVTSGDVQVPKVNVRWHYKGVTGSGGGWSATYSVIPH